MGAKVTGRIIIAITLLQMFLLGFISFWMFIIVVARICFLIKLKGFKMYIELRLTLEWIAVFFMLVGCTFFLKNITALKAFEYILPAVVVTLIELEDHVNVYFITKEIKEKVKDEK